MKTKLVKLLILLLCLGVNISVNACSGGYYETGVGCYQCPKGYFCSGTSAPVKCNAGQYSDFGQSSCSSCPAGFSCSSPSAIPVPCSFGQYTDGGQIGCLACPPGSYCPTPATRTDCTYSGAGSYYYCLGGTKGQILCPAGYMCPNKYSAPVQCANGQYSAAGSNVCNDCAAGSACAHPSLTPMTCPTGFYSTSKATSCTACPVDHSCSSTSTLPTACAQGYYSPGMATTCTQCPAGYYCDRVAHPGVPQRCSAGYYAAAGSTQCISCPPGYQCYDGQATACTAGYYSAGGSNLCTKCPAGQYCSYLSTAPIACPSGTHSGPGASSCTVCSAGYYCPRVDMNIEINCPKGTYQSLAGQTSCQACKGSGCSTVAATSVTYCTAGYYFDGLFSCTQCPAGFYCPDPRATTVTPCPSGFYSSAGQQKCSICQPGYYCGDGTAMTACASGSYSVYGQVACTKCPPGYACNANTKTIFGIMLCPPGYYVLSNVCTACPQGSFCPYPEFGPVTCPTGTYTKALGMSVCQACPHGYSCTNAGGMTACTSGTYSYLYENTCNACPAGNLCLNGVKSDCPLNYYQGAGATTCTPCPAGSECLRQSPTTCGAGYYSYTLTYTCRPCPPGYTCAGSTAPVACLVGTYAPNEGMTTCSTCPTGTYNTVGSSQCYPCPGGYSCTGGTMTRCLPGTYSPQGAGVCTNGNPGYVYGPYSDDAMPAFSIAPKGTYSSALASGQIALYKCAAGTYSPVLGATDVSTCLTCPEGFYCPIGTGDPLLYECPQGYYCTSGSSLPTACPASTYSLIKGATSATMCRPCTLGFQCAGASGTPIACPLGYYCPGGASQPCPAGTYSGYRTGLRTADECVICPAGYYCIAGSAAPTPSPMGSYNPWMGMSALNNMMKCPPSYPCPTTGLTTFKGPPCTLGYYCPGGTVNPNDNPCPAGTYSNSYYTTNQYECMPCPRGYGCIAGTTQSTLVVCTAGYYCPRGTIAANALPCPAGTYRTNTGATKFEDCLPCPHGKFCIQATVTPAACQAGYYCPLGTKSATQYPCRAGTYTAATTLQSQEGCTQCGLGNYCPSASTAPTPCGTGNYNNFSYEASSCLPCPAGSLCSTTTTINPTLCAIGKYSDLGATACTDCEIGYYCPELGISAAMKLSLYVCTAGCWCANGAIGLSTYPNLDDNGCPIGKYCPAGAVTPTDCPAGTYNPVKGRGSLSDCLTTPAGYYTAAAASSYTATPCSAGYFCLAGSSSATQYPCPPGTYRGIVQAASPLECSPCPSGYYCLSATATPANCPAGFYCPIGTSRPESCPEGTYSGSLNLFDSKSCTPCDAGRYCYQRNLTSPINNCDAGFYCIQGSQRPEPLDGITGNLCPLGGYCPSGCSTPQACSAGTLMIITGASAQSQCVSCTPGYYCLGTNSATPSGKCDPGYFCGFGAQVAAPAGNQATSGHYAPSGSQFQLSCPRGQYSNQVGLAACTECDAGYFCGDVGMTTKPACPAGYYCQTLSWFNSQGLSYDKTPCPPGSFNSQTGRASLNDCVGCTGGSYCDIPGLTAVVGTCDAGFFCKTNSPYKRPPVTDAGGRYGPCPAGSYCPAGSTNPTPCPAGKYSNSIMLTIDTQCLDCYEGKYCATAGLTAPTGDCTPGYYCASGQTIPNPTGCNAPLYCPAGVGAAIQCPTGFYQDSNNQGYCKECPSGSYCNKGTIMDCPRGFYCP